MANDPGNNSSRPGAVRSRRRPVACTFCRAKKIRCNGNTPCSNCLDHGKTCVVSRPRHSRLQDAPDELRRRLEHVEALVEKADGSPASGSTSTPAIPSTRSPDTQRSNRRGQSLVFIQESLGLATPQTVSDEQSNGVAAPAHEEPDIARKEPDGIYVAQAPSHEYFGPTSFLSLCSSAGIDWVNSKSTSEDFKPVAVSLMTGMARRLKVEGTLPTVRALEPDSNTAWNYSAEYFSNAPESAFGIVDQTWFNARLQAHFDHARDDSAWYALRNALLAAGCRIYLSKTAGFREAKRASWALFENAMACLPNLLLYSSSVIGVQALTLMAYFSEGLSSPSLQYMLTSNAMRLACSMGMHRQSAPSWNMPRSEAEHRSRLFWAIYCLEKQTVSRSGRPSMIDDEEISACLLDQINVPPFCRLLVHLSQVSSLVTKRLSNTTSLKQNITELAATVSDLSSELDRFKSAAFERHGFDVSQPLDILKLPNGLDSRQALIIYFFYHCILLSIHVSPFRPWAYTTTERQNDSSSASAASHAASRASVVHACRSIILASKSVHVDASCASLVAGFGLIYASICTFTYILHAADADTCRSELLLLDIAVGCSHNLELQTEGEWSLPFLKDLRRIAGTVVEPSHTNGSNPGRPLHPIATVRPPSQGDVEAESHGTNDDVVFSLETLPPFETPLSDDLDMWSTLLQLPDSGDGSGIPW